MLFKLVKLFNHAHSYSYSCWMSVRSLLFLLPLLLLRPLHADSHLPGLHPVLHDWSLTSPEPGGLLVQVPQVGRPQEEVQEAQQHGARGASEGP